MNCGILPGIAVERDYSWSISDGAPTTVTSCEHTRRINRVDLSINQILMTSWPLCAAPRATDPCEVYDAIHRSYRFSKISERKIKNATETQRIRQINHSQPHDFFPIRDAFMSFFVICWKLYCWSLRDGNGSIAMLWQFNSFVTFINKLENNLI